MRTRPRNRRRFIIPRRDYEQALEKARVFFTVFSNQTEPITFTNGRQTWTITREEALR